MPARSAFYAISTNVSQGIAPRNPGLGAYEGKIIDFPNSRGENVENIEITNHLRSLLRSENLQGAAMIDPTREEFDAKLTTVEARTDTKIARMEGKLDLVVSKIDGINSRLDDVRHDYRATRANIWVVGLGLAVLIVGVAALFPVFFGVGTQMRDIIDKAIEAHISSTTSAPPRR